MCETKDFSEQRLVRRHLSWLPHSCREYSNSVLSTLLQVDLTGELEKCSLRIDDLMKKVVTSPKKLKSVSSHSLEFYSACPHGSA